MLNDESFQGPTGFFCASVLTLTSSHRNILSNRNCKLRLWGFFWKDEVGRETIIKYWFCLQKMNWGHPLNSILISWEGKCTFLLSCSSSTSALKFSWYLKKRYLIFHTTTNLTFEKSYYRAQRPKYRKSQNFRVGRSLGNQQRLPAIPPQSCSVLWMKMSFLFLSYLVFRTFQDSTWKEHTVWGWGV